MIPEDEDLKKEKEEKGEEASEPSAKAVREPPPVVAGVGDLLFERAKKHLVLACAAIALGLAVAGSLDRTTGGVILLIGWLTAVASLHRLGRAGSERRAKP